MPLQLSDLLSKGYFPKELPPPFTTASYSLALSGPLAAPPADTFSGQPKYSPPCVHNLIRTGGLRRNLAIPNPKHFFRLAGHVVTNWANLTGLTSVSPFSLTKPVDGGTDRAISPEHDLSERANFRAKLRSTHRFLLKADISRFFPSIYTHSIPWAVMGKPAAKAAHVAKTLEGTWPDATDTFSRSIFNNQTIGIPIGPDTSRLIAEVLLARIDIELANKFRRLKGLRYIDDYEFAFATRSEAEAVLSYLQHLLNDFELALNANKTMILDLPDFLDSPWTSRIRAFVFRDAGVAGQRNDLTAYFDMVFDFFKRYPEEGLLKYAIARLQSQEIERENWPLFESLLNHCVLIDPACIPQVCDQIAHYRTVHFPIRKRIWSNCLNTIVSERVPLGQSSEAAWAMWLMRLLGVKLLVKSAKAVGNTEDSVVGLMALGLVSIGLATLAHLNGLSRFSTSAGLFENQWLLCYQGNLMGWLGQGSGRVNLRRDPAFAYLEAQNVSFFDIGVTPPAPIRHAAGALGTAY
jgi:Reverse transcriptase (RNA-dependent DNA polymerase)